MRLTGAGLGEVRNRRGQLAGVALPGVEGDQTEAVALVDRRNRVLLVDEAAPGGVAADSPPRERGEPEERLRRLADGPGGGSRAGGGAPSPWEGAEGGRERGRG